MVEAHADELFEPLSDPALYLYMPRPPFDSAAALRARIRRFLARRSHDGDQTCLQWVLRAGSVPVGTIDATVHPDHVADLGYTVFVSEQRRGYASEAMRWLLTWLPEALGVVAFRASVDTRNTGSIAVLRRCGFSRVETYPVELDGAATMHHLYLRRA